MFPTENEVRRKILMIDSKSFYASCECVDLGLNPMKALLVVMSQADNTNGGLVLASSPMAKKTFGISNVTRHRDLPDDPRLIIVPPRMNYYIKENKRVNDIFREFVAEEDLQLYSIDESILDVTDSWGYLQTKYGHDLTLKGLARIIQLEVKQRLGLYLTVGIGDNPTMAKLALDLESKHNHSLIAEWHYEQVPDKLWSIHDLSEVWSIGRRTAKKLNQMGLCTMGDIALADPQYLMERFGVKGADLFALAWGVDRSRLSDKYQPKGASISNSQVLPRDYVQASEIKNVIREIGEQIAARLRAKGQACQVVHLYVGAALSESEPGFSGQISIDPTNRAKRIVGALYQLFDSQYDGQSIRHIGVSVGKLIPDVAEQMDLFIEPTINMKEQTIEHVVDDIRHKFGTTAIVKLASTDNGGTMIDRAGLVGGHSGGNAYG
ncbi:Y-family DNA polymerase [Weissella viridescens]|uniref:Y-family DNA polymerase n=1 Tax=Weissella viridescens TaxID=1629 RepID=UPI004055AF86